MGESHTYAEGRSFSYSGRKGLPRTVSSEPHLEEERPLLHTHHNCPQPPVTLQLLHTESGVTLTLISPYCPSQANLRHLPNRLPPVWVGPTPTRFISEVELFDGRKCWNFKWVPPLATRFVLKFCCHVVCGPGFPGSGRELRNLVVRMKTSQ